ncbi:hypothetical protein [Sulfitobacter aestuariivivens]|uniref:hypothetical protein n=1 Tax=Sulfitobacter aestuariivivens TaxID=2766981 RepID=UPI003620B6F1
MLSIGIIALLVGAIAMGGGGDDDVEFEEVPVTPEPEDDAVNTGNSDAEALSLVAADRADGSVVDSQSVVAQGPTFDEEDERDYIVRPYATGASEFDIGYDPDISFRLDLVTDISSANVGLNTDIGSHHQEVDVNHEQSLAADGAVISETTITPIYAGATDITYEVTPDQIGQHAAFIDLSNPGHTLNFEFGAGLTGNLHMFTEATTYDGANSGTGTEQTMYLIHTPDSVTGLTEAEARDIIAGDGATEDGMTLVAEIYLGGDTLTIAGNDIVVRDFMNETPTISSNVAFTSTEPLAVSQINGVTDGGTTGDTGGVPLVDTTGGDTTGGGTGNP